MQQPARLKNSRIRDHISNMESIERSGHLVYVLWCPLEKVIKYVGYTRIYPWDRLGAHLSDGRKLKKSLKGQWLAKLEAVGLLPTMRLMRSFTDRAAAYKYEAELIASIGARRTLTNTYPGNPNWKPSPGWHFEGGKEPVYISGPNQAIPPMPWLLGGQSPI